ncbi:MAG: hypothetical protein MUF37_07745 [Methanoregulaceae archaeon]|jgi:hypothetical protein|nr:hypothetical protein [Methanoregulaceae archaeon]
MNAKSLYALVLGTVFFLMFVSLLSPYYAQWPAVTPAGSSAGVVLWEGRTFETVFQGFILLAGVISILLLVRSGTDGRRPP